MQHFQHIHWIPVLVMTILSFGMGFLWHQPFLFGRIWSRENNPSNGPVTINAPLIFGGTAFVHFIAMAGLGVLTAGRGWQHGLAAGFFISVAWIFPAMTGTYLFANRSLRLLFIDAGMYIVLFSIAGLVLGAW